MQAAIHARRFRSHLHRSSRAIALCIALMAPTSGMSMVIPENAVEFESGFIRAFGQDIDLSRFERDETVTEGDHPVELIINDASFGTQTLPFRRKPETGRIEACFHAALVVRMGLDPAKQIQLPEDSECPFLDQLVAGGVVDHDGGEQKLSVTIPQAYLLYKARGYVPPDALDQGIDGAAFRYTVSYARNQNTSGTAGQYAYGGLQGAFNHGAWRFRTFGTLTSNARQPTRWNHVAAYAQRPLPKMQAEAILGDWSTTGTLFDSTPVRGANLSTDDRMLPESLRGYAPVIRGVARSNAVVSVRQGTNVIFESNVPPGEFEFRDLYATGYGGDLDVSVTEADGEVQNFKVPYGSIAQLLRADYTKYSLTFGQIRDAAISHAPFLMEGTVQHGLTENVTAYGGAQMTASTYYAAVMGGLAVNTPMGALGMDLTQSFALCMDTASRCNKSGYSVRTSLGKQLSSTGTYFSLVGYRYSSSGYYSLMDAMRLRAVGLGNTSVEPPRLRDRLDINVTQSLGQKWGNFFLTGSYGRRWKDKERTLSFQAGYTNSLGRARYNISLGRSRNALGADEASVFMSVSMPIGRSGASGAPTLGLSSSRTESAADMRANLIGNIDENGRSSYDAWFDAASGGSRSFGGTVGYAGNAVKGNLAYGHASGTHSIGANANGGILIHGDGVNFASELGDTVALVRADGAAGAQVLPFQRTTIGKNGTAIVPYITPYRWNSVELDLKGADVGVKVDNTRMTTAPTAGAIVRLKFDSRLSTSAVLRLRQRNGTPVPFGASVRPADGVDVGTVGSDGIVVASDLPANGDLLVAWGRSVAQQCTVHYEPTVAKDVAIHGWLEVRDMTCEPAPEAPARLAQKEHA